MDVMEVLARIYTNDATMLNDVVPYLKFPVVGEGATSQYVRTYDDAWLLARLHACIL